MQIAKTLCEEHLAVLDEEVVCKDNTHFCLWCGTSIGPCDCFLGFHDTPEAILTIQTYIHNLEQLFQRQLRPTEKKAIIQLFIEIEEG